MDNPFSPPQALGDGTGVNLVSTRVGRAVRENTAGYKPAQQIDMRDERTQALQSDPYRPKGSARNGAKARCESAMRDFLYQQDDPEQSSRIDTHGVVERDPETGEFKRYDG